MLILPSVARFDHGRVHVRVEDVSYADTRSITVAEMVIPEASHDPANGSAPTMLPFTLALPSLDPGHDYSVRAWIEGATDPARSRTLAATNQTYPVLTRGHGTDVTVRLGAESTRNRV